jgi:cell division protein FtsW
MDVSIYRLRHRDILTICVLALLCLGVVMVQSASMNVTGQLGWRWTGSSLKDIFFAIFAVAAFFIIGHIDYSTLVRGNAKIWRQPIVWVMAATTFACLIVLVPHVGIEVNGARRWLPLGICQVQPSELAKWAVVLFLAWWLTEQPVDLNHFGKGFLLTLAPIAAICLLIVIQDFGTAALIALCALSMLIVGKIKWWHLAIVIPPAIAAGMWFVMHKEYRWRRMTAFVDPWADPKGEGYHMIQSLLSFSTGGVTGRGLGNGIQKLGYLPEDTTDFIFAVICEELGLFGALLTVALYLGILYVAWQAVKENRDSFGRLLAFGIASMIGLQAMINIAVATVSVPTKGLSLPLVSAGGSGLVITCAALGLLYSISRFSKPQEAAKDFESEPIMEPISTSSLFVHSIWQQLTVQETDESVK